MFKMMENTGAIKGKYIKYNSLNKFNEMLYRKQALILCNHLKTFQSKYINRDVY